MNSDIIIRKAKIDDFMQVHKLVMQVHKEHVKAREDIYRNSNPLDIDMFKEESTDINNVYLVAEQDNRIIGICFSKIKEINNNKIMKDRKILHIEDICVDKSKQRTGIGTLLYQEILKIAKEQKVNSVELMVWSFNNNAIKFYENLGMNVKNLKFEYKIT